MLRLATKSLSTLREHRPRGVIARKNASLRGSPPAAQLPPGVTDLIYELLDAHLDTLVLLSEAESVVARQAHLDYLRALQRLGRAALAHWTQEPRVE